VIAIALSVSTGAFQTSPMERGQQFGTGIGTLAAIAAAIAFVLRKRALATHPELLRVVSVRRSHVTAKHAVIAPREEREAPRAVAVDALELLSSQSEQRDSRLDAR
jgi:hypothetical protein